MDIGEWYEVPHEAGTSVMKLGRSAGEGGSVEGCVMRYMDEDGCALVFLPGVLAEVLAGWPEEQRRPHGVYTS